MDFSIKHRQRLIRRESKDASRRRGIVFELLDVATLDLLHEGLALEEVTLEVGGELAWHDEKLIVHHFGERDRPTRGDKMRTPLEHEADVPDSEGGEKSASGGERGAARMEGLSGAVDENGEA
jgi:hypothetical protein